MGFVTCSYHVVPLLEQQDRLHVTTITPTSCKNPPALPFLATVFLAPRPTIHPLHGVEAVPSDVLSARLALERHLVKVVSGRTPTGALLDEMLRRVALVTPVERGL